MQDLLGSGSIADGDDRRISCIGSVDGCERAPEAVGSTHSAEPTPPQYAGFETFHPTFLYESLGNLIVVGLILRAERRFPAIRGKLLALYLVGYGMLRFGMELLRTDTTFRFLGLSRNAWVSLGVILVGIVVAARLQPIDRQPLGGLGPGRSAPTAT